MLLRQIISMFCIALCGVVLTKVGFLDSKGSKTLGVVALYLAAPCSIIYAFQTPFSASKLEEIFVTFIATLLIQSLNAGIVWLLCLGKRSLTVGERASVLFNNANNLILPLVAGSLGQSYVVYTTTYVCTLSLQMWSYGIILMGGREAFSAKKMLKTPAIIAVFIGLLLFLMNVTLPGSVAAAVSSMGNCIGPLSMLGIGSLLAETDLKKTFSKPSLYRVVFLRLIALPLMAVLMLKGVALIWGNTDAQNILTVTLLCAIGPSATTITQMAQRYDNPESGYISSINVATVVVSIVTIPIIVFLFRCL